MGLYKYERLNKTLNIYEKYCVGCKAWKQTKHFAIISTLHGGRPPNSRFCVACRNAERLTVRTPRWVDKQALREIYNNCPAGHEVDHVIPLRGKTVSGLHVPSNLQYLPIAANRLKSNKYEIRPEG